VTDDLAGNRVGFEVDGETLLVRDALEQADLRLELDVTPDVCRALPELFPLPVDEAVSFEAGSLSVPAYSSVSVRAGNGDFIARLDEPMELPRGSYSSRGPTPSGKASKWSRMVGSEQSSPQNRSLQARFETSSGW
jgi:hypothetical protein